jgi:uncharacterized protein YyaL (SSP411 family)
LLGIRAQRPQPARDDKVVAAWNGLAIAALAETGALLGESRFVDAATDCAELLTTTHVVDGRLRRVSRDGIVGAPAGVLDDHASLAEGLLVLHQIAGEKRWLDVAEQLLGLVLDHFAGDEPGVLYDTGRDAEKLIARPASPDDGATPGGASAAAGALLTAAALTGSSRWRQAAGDALGRLGALLTQAPRAAGWTAAVCEAWLAGPVEVAVVDRPDLLALTRRSTSPGAVVVASPADTPLLAGRPDPAAYVCRGTVCDLPTTDPAVLAAQLSVRQA